MTSRRMSCIAWSAFFRRGIDSPGIWTGGVRGPVVGVVRGLWLAHRRASCPSRVGRGADPGCVGGGGSWACLWRGRTRPDVKPRRMSCTAWWALLSPGHRPGVTGGPGASLSGGCGGCTLRWGVRRSGASLPGRRGRCIPPWGARWSGASPAGRCGGRTPLWCARRAAVSPPGQRDRCTPPGRDPERGEIRPLRSCSVPRQVPPTYPVGFRGQRRKAARTAGRGVRAFGALSRGR
jgi:hypothetical protein